MSSVATIRSHRVAGEAAAGDDRDSGGEAGDPRPEGERPRVERRDDRVVGVAGPAAAALGEQDRRQPHPLDQLEQPVLLAMAEDALGPGQDHVVVGEDRAGRAIAELLAVDPGGPRDQPVGGRSLEQLADLASGPLSGDREASVLDEAVRIDEVGEVLAGRSPSGRMALLDGLGARLVGQQRPTLAELRELRPRGLVLLWRRFGAHGERSYPCIPPPGPG